MGVRNGWEAGSSVDICGVEAGARGIYLGFIALGIVAAAAPASAVVIVAPNASAAVEGGSNNCIGLTGCAGRDRYQQVYNSSEFGALSGPELITRIAFRPDEGEGAFVMNFANVQVKLSTTTAAADGLSGTFATNSGADLTTVYSGALALSSAGVAIGPGPFDVIINLQTPFLYDPSLGNLLFEFMNISSEEFAGISLDAVNAADSVSRLFSFGAANEPTGIRDTTGFVTQFTTRAASMVVPEPSTLALFAVGFAGLAFASSRRRQLRPGQAV